MSRLQHYRVFVEIVETGSISQAANTLNYSAPAISKQLTKLEQNLQVQLFNRSHKKLEITEAGKRFYPRCKSILASISHAEDELLEEESAFKGTISITMSKALARSNIFDVLSAFSDQYPDIQFDLHFSDNLEDLLDENIDYALRLGKLQDNSHMVAIPLLETQLVACATPQYLKLHGIPQSFSDLGSAKLIAMSPQNSSEALKLFFNKENSQLSNINTHRCNDIEGIYQATLASLGIGMMLDISIKKELQEGIFTSILAERNLPRKRMYLLFKKSRYRSQKQMVFKAFIKSQLSNRSN